MLRFVRHRVPLLAAGAIGVSSDVRARSWPPLARPMSRGMQPGGGLACSAASSLRTAIRFASASAASGNAGSGSGHGADGKGGSSGSGGHGSSSDSKGGHHTKEGQGSPLKLKSSKKKTKIVKKLVRTPHKSGGAGRSNSGAAAAGSGSGSGTSSSSSSTTATATASGAPAGGKSAGTASAPSYRSAGIRGKNKKKISKKLLKRKRPTTSTTTASASSNGSNHNTSTSNSHGSGVATSGGSSGNHNNKTKKNSGAKSGTSRTPTKGTASSSGSHPSSSPTAAAKAKGKGKGNAKAKGKGKARNNASPRKGKTHRNKRLRVCVLNSSYDGADSATAAVDNFLCTPEHYAKKDKKKYAFDDISIKKIDSFRTVRELVTSGRYDVFFNLCDGGRDEKRAGVDVVEALEEMNAAFTGTDSRSFEPSKIDMKLLVGSCGVKVPNFVLLENAESLAKKCRHLRFPVIVKHLSGYASVGIHKDNRCDDLDQLKKKVPAFIKEYNHALVEEFIRGREGTVLACADAASPHGVKVFKPLMFNFLKDGDDFAYFDKKWGMTCDDKAYGFLPHNDPAYGAIVEMARNAYKYIMNGVGYGRVDFRIDDRTGEPNFLEINPNCGMWYSEKDGGDFADIMVQGDANWDHERFLANAVTRALREQAARRPWYFISHDKSGQFSTRASRTVPAGKCLFGDAVHPIPVVSKSLYKLGAEDPSVGAVICRGDGIHQAVAIRHSCEPNMQFVHGRTLLFAAKRQISVGEELTVDYATLRDENMPTFACSCGTQNCRSVIFAMPATARSLEVKAAKKMLREKKRVWLKERMAEREAERLLKKRSAASSSSSSSLASSGSGSNAGGSSSTSGHGSSHNNNSGSGSGSSSSSSAGNAGGATHK